MKRSPDWRGYEQRPRNQTTVLEFGREYGYLTAHHQSRGDARYSVFSCRCGEKVIRMSSDVAEAVKVGRVPMCKACRSAERKAG